MYCIVLYCASMVIIDGFCVKHWKWRTLKIWTDSRRVRSFCWVTYFTVQTINASRWTWWRRRCSSRPKFPISTSSTGPLLFSKVCFSHHLLILSYLYWYNLGQIFHITIYLLLHYTLLMIHICNVSFFSSVRILCWYI